MVSRRFPTGHCDRKPRSWRPDNNVLTMSNSRPRRHATQGIHLLLVSGTLLLAAGTLVACSTVIDALPTAAGGLPADTPPRPPEPPPAIPLAGAPARDTAPLSAQERKRLEDELIGIRDRQAASAAALAANGEPANPAAAAPPPANIDQAAKPSAKKKPAQEPANGTPN